MPLVAVAPRFPAETAYAASLLAATVGVTAYSWINNAGIETYENGDPGVAAAPTGFIATSSTRTSANLVWDPIFNGNAALTSLIVSWNNAATGAIAGVTTISTAATSYTITGLSANTSYTVSLTARNAYGDAVSTVALPVQIPISTMPISPASLTLTPGGNQITASWAVPSDTGGASVTNYTYIISATDGTYSVTGTTSSTSVVLTGLAKKPYVVSVRASNASNTGWAEAIATPTLASLAGAPTGLTPTAGNRQVALAWTAPVSTGGVSLTDYFVEWSTDGINFTGSGYVGSATAAYTVTSLIYGNTYTFRVSAVNGIGIGSPSSTTTSTPTASAPATPSAPTVAAGNAQVTVQYVLPADNGAAITAFKVEKSDSTSTYTTWTTVTTAASTSGSYTATGLTNGLSYKFRVSAINPVGTGSASTASSVVTPINIPATVVFGLGSDGASNSYLVAPNTGYTTWTGSTPTDTTLNVWLYGLNVPSGMAFNPSGVGVVNSTGQIGRSTDGGATWSDANGGTQVAPQATSVTAKVMTWVNGYFLMGTSARKVNYSTDGNTWSQNAPGGVGNVKAFAYGIGSGAGGQARYILVGTGASTSVAGAAYTNTDPSGTWTWSGSVTGNPWYGAAFGNGTFVAVGGASGVARFSTSTEGITWADSTTPGSVSAQMWDVCWGGGKFVAVGKGGLIVTALDSAPTSWTKQTSPVTTDLKTVIYVNSKFFANTVDGKVIVSSDGVTWNSYTATSATVLYCIAGY
jgi:hypothetical protein